MRMVIRIISIIWCVLLFVWSGFSVYNILTGKDGLPKDTGIQKMLQKLLTANCACHDELIHLYGGWVRYSGRRVCNNVLRLPSAQLIQNYGMRSFDPTKHARALGDLNTMLNRDGRKFLYVQFPKKMDRCCRLLPKGYPREYSHQVVDNLLKHLDELHVPYVDTRSMLDETPESVDRYFLRTDHHWNFDGAFKVFPAVALAVARVLKVDEGEIEDYIKPEAWNCFKMPRKFLGSAGRRVGLLFADAEEMIYYLPAFETDIRKEIESRNVDLTGPFQESVFDNCLLEQPISPFHDCGYSIYGNDYSHVRYTNLNAPINRHLLISKDSYALPIIAWFSTIFRQIDVVDLRYFKKMTFKESVTVWNPDLVMVMHTPDSIGTSLNRMWDFGLTGESIAVKLIHSADKVEIMPKNHSHNYVKFEDRLVSGALYRLTVLEMKVFAGQTEKVTVALYNKKMRRTVERKTFSLGGPLEWILKMPEDVDGCSILLYAGEIGHTDNVGVVWQNIALELINKGE